MEKESKRIGAVIQVAESMYDRMQSIQVFTTENNVAGMYEAMTFAKTIIETLNSMKKDAMAKEASNDSDSK